MDKVKKVYIDSRYKTNDSVSNSDFKFELKESLDLPDNTFAFIDDICIPHSWYTIEEYNNKLYIVTNLTDSDGYNFYNTFALEIPIGNYNGPSLATAIQEELQYAEPTHNFIVVYNSNRGSITIKSSSSLFTVLSDSQVSYFSNNTSVNWVNKDKESVSINLFHPLSLNEVMRHNESSSFLPWINEGVNEFESGFIDLLNVHNIYIHSSDLGHYNSIGVRGENTIIKKVPVSSSYGFLIVDSVISQHDKIDVSKQLIKTLHFSLKNVHGDVIDLHGAHISLSIIFQTIA